MSHTFSSVVTGLFDLLLTPFAGNATLALSVISLLCGVAMIFLFKATSDQSRIRRVRDLLKARILEMRIYQDDLRLILRALGMALWTNVAYLRVTWKPILALVIFAALVVIQLEARFGRAPLHTNETATLTLTLSGDADVMRVPLSVETGRGAIIDVPAVRVPARGEASWRIRVTESGTHPIALLAAAQTYRFDLAAQPGTHVIGRARSHSFWDGLVNLGLPKLADDSPIASISVHYPGAMHRLLMWKVHWLLVFIAWSLIGAMVPKFLFGIEV